MASRQRRVPTYQELVAARGGYGISQKNKETYFQTKAPGILGMVNRGLAELADAPVAVFTAADAAMEKGARHLQEKAKGTVFQDLPRTLYGALTETPVPVLAARQAVLRTPGVVRATGKGAKAAGKTAKEIVKDESGVLQLPPKRPTNWNPRNVDFDPVTQTVTHKDWPKGSFPTPAAPQFGRRSGKSKLDPGKVEVEKVQTGALTQRKRLDGNDLRTDKDVIVPTVADRADGSTSVLGVDGVKNENAVQTWGGSKYARAQDNFDAGRAWATDKGGATKLTGALTAVPEGGRLIHTGLIQAPSGINFSGQMSDMFINQMHAMPSSAIDYIDDMARQFPGMPSLKTPEGRQAATAWLLEQPGGVRVKFMEGVTNPKAAAAGVPDIGPIRAAVSDPSLYDAPAGTMGHVYNTIEGRHSGRSNHPSYEGALSGRYLGSGDHALPVWTLLPDVMRERVGQMSASGGRPVSGNDLLSYIRQGNAKQVVTPEVQENITRYNEYMDRFGATPFQFDR